MLIKKSISIAFFICFNMLISNSLFSQSIAREFKMIGSDSMKYAINQSGDSIFSVKVKGENLRYVMDEKGSRVVNAKNETIYYQERMPEFPNGYDEMQRFLANNIRYPKIAKEKGAQGTVYIGLIVNKDGRLSDIHVKGLGKNFKAKSEAKQRREEKKIPAEIYRAIEEEAVRVVNLMPNWTPGMQQNKAVGVAYTLPIKFKLE